MTKIIKEFDGVWYEFDSFKDYVEFLFGRVLGYIIFFGGLYLLFKYVL